ncbi:MAG: LysR family transcriptional regulator [Actinomycetota bacterium]|nr:LysR family transcriptional regulator [Actinomycetota bacterium]
MSSDAPILDVGRLRLLREVGLRGSIAGAARSFGLTSSAVSQQLSALEKDAGTALVDRSPRGVSLTGAGLALAARAGNLLDILSAARADLDRIAGSIAGPVTIASVPSAAATFVSGAVRSLRALHPGIAVSVRTAEPAHAFDVLMDSDVDLAVVDEYDHVPLALPELVVARQLCAEALVLVASSGSLGRRRPRLAELAQADWVMPPEYAACGQAVRSACRASGFEPRVRWETDDMLLLVRAVAHGHGIAVLPRMSVEAACGPAPGVDVWPLREPPLNRKLLAVGRASVLARPVLEAVLAQLVTSAAGT